MGPVIGPVAAAAAAAAAVVADMVTDWTQVAADIDGIAGDQASGEKSCPGRMGTSVDPNGYAARDTNFRFDG